MAQSIKPSYPIFPLTPFSQSLYSSRVNLSRSLRFPFTFPKRGEYPFDVGSFASSPSHTFSFIQRRYIFLPLLLSVALYLSTNITRNLSLSLSPSLFLSFFLSLLSSSWRLHRPTCSVPRFSSATPNRDNSNGCETDALPEFTPGLITILSLEGYEERASGLFAWLLACLTACLPACLPACLLVVVVSWQRRGPDARHAKWLIRVLGRNKISV